MSSKGPTKPPNIVWLSFWVLALCWIGSSIVTPVLGKIQNPEAHRPPRVAKRYPESLSQASNATSLEIKIPKGYCYEHEHCNSTSECERNEDKSNRYGLCKQCEKIFEGAFYCPNRKPKVVFCPQNSTIGTLPGFGSGLPIKGHISGHIDFSFEVGQSVGCNTQPNCNAPVEKPNCGMLDILKIPGSKPECQPGPVPSGPSGNVDFKTLCELARLDVQIRLALGGAYKLFCENGSEIVPSFPTFPDSNETTIDPFETTPGSKQTPPTRFPPVLPFSRFTSEPRPSKYPVHVPTQNANPPEQESTDYPIFTPSQNANSPGFQDTDHPIFVPTPNAIPPAQRNYSVFVPTPNAELPPVVEVTTPKYRFTDFWITGKQSKVTKIPGPHPRHSTYSPRPGLSFSPLYPTTGGPPQRLQTTRIVPVHHSTPRKHHTHRPTVVHGKSTPLPVVTLFSRGPHERTTRRPHSSDGPPARVQTTRVPLIHTYGTPKGHVKTVRPQTVTRYHHRRTTPGPRHTDYPMHSPSQNANSPGPQYTDYPIFSPSQNANSPGFEITDYPLFTPTQNANPPSQKNSSVFVPSQNAETPTPSPVHSRRTHKTRKPTLKTRKTRPPHVHPHKTTPEPLVTRPPHVHHSKSTSRHPRVISVVVPEATTPRHGLTDIFTRKTHSTKKHRPTRPPHHRTSRPLPPWQTAVVVDVTSVDQDETTTPSARQTTEQCSDPNKCPKLKTRPPKIVIPPRTIKPRVNEPSTDHTVGHETRTPGTPKVPKVTKKTPRPRNNEPTTPGSEILEPESTKRPRITRRPKPRSPKPRNNEPSTPGSEIIASKSTKHPKIPRGPKSPKPRNNEPSTPGSEIIASKSTKHPTIPRGPKSPKPRNNEPSTPGYEITTGRPSKGTNRPLTPRTTSEPSTARYKVTTGRSSRGTEKHLSPRWNEPEVTTPQVPKVTEEHHGKRPTRPKKYPTPRWNEPEATTPQAPEVTRGRRTKRPTPPRNEPSTDRYETVTPEFPKASPRVPKVTPSPRRNDPSTPKFAVHTPRIPKVSRKPKPKPTGGPKPTPDDRHGHNDGGSTPVTSWPKFSPITESGEVTKHKRHEKIQLEMSVSVESGPPTRPPTSAELFGEELHHVTRRTRKPRQKKTQQFAFSAFSSDIEPEEEESEEINPVTTQRPSKKAKQQAFKQFAFSAFEPDEDVQEKKPVTTQKPPKKPKKQHIAAFSAFSSDLEADEGIQDEAPLTTPKPPKKAAAKKSVTPKKPKAPKLGSSADLAEHSNGGLLKARKPKAGPETKVTTGEPLVTHTVQAVKSVSKKPSKPLLKSANQSKSDRPGRLVPKPTPEITLKSGGKIRKISDRSNKPWGEEPATQTVRPVTNAPAKAKTVTPKKPKSVLKSIKSSGLKSLKSTAGDHLTTAPVLIRETVTPKVPQDHPKSGGIRTFSNQIAPLSPEVSGGLTQGPLILGSETTPVKPKVKSGRRSLKKSSGQADGRDKASDRALVPPAPSTSGYSTVTPRRPESSVTGTTQVKPKVKSLNSNGKPADVNTFALKARPPVASGPETTAASIRPQESGLKTTQLLSQDRKVTPGGTLARQITTENPLKKKSAELIKEGIEELISSDEKQPIKCNPKANNGSGDCPSGYRCYPPFPKSSFGYCYENEEFSPADEKPSKSSSASEELKPGRS